MRLVRNIDKAGRSLRLLAGVLLFLSGAAGIIWNLPGAGGGWRLFQVLLIGAGIFAILEGLIGWCALRALGIRTRR